VASNFLLWERGFKDLSVAGFKGDIVFGPAKMQPCNQQMDHELCSQ